MNEFLEMGGEKNTGNKNTEMADAQRYVGGVLSYFLENCLDGEGNLKSIPQLFGEHYKEDKSYADMETGRFVEIPGVEEFLLQETQEKSRLASEQALILCEFVREIAQDLFDEGLEEQSRDLLNKLKTIADQPDTNFLVRTYLLHVLSVSGYNKYFGDKQAIDGTRRENFISDFHLEDLSNVRIDFTPEVAEKILQDREDDDSWRVLPGDRLYPMEKTFDEVDEQYCYRGDYVISRLSPSKIGVYTCKGNLVGWYDAEDLEESFVGDEDGTDNVRLRTVGGLVERADSSDKKNIFLFKTMESLAMRSEIKNVCGIDISQLNIRTQYQFLKFISSKNSQEVAPFLDFIKNCPNERAKNNRVTTFLSLEYGQDMAQVIQKIAENTEEQMAQAIFDKYAEIVKITNKIDDYLQENFGDQPREVRDEVIENLLRRGKDLLVEFSKSDKIDEKDIMPRLDAVRTEILLFASAFKQVSREQGVDLEQIKNISLEIVGPQELSAKDKEELMEVHLKNRPGSSEALMQVYRDGLNKGFNNPNDRFYVLRHNQEGLLSFVKFTDREDGSVYASAFNTVSSAQNATIGSVFLDKAFQMEGAYHDLAFSVKADSPMFKHYRDDFGFKVIEEDNNFLGSGEKFYRMYRPAAQAEALAA